MSGTSELTLPPVEVTAKRDLPPPTQPEQRVVGAPTPYIRRRIDVVFTLGTGNFGEQGQNTVTLRDKRCSVTVNKAQLGAKTTCSLRIWGMLFSQMQQLSTYGHLFAATWKYTVEVLAGDDLAGMTRIFIGTINNAYFDGESQPDVAFQVEASEGAFAEMKPAPPISVAGGVDVAGVMQTLAKQIGATFENHGVVAKLRDIYYPGTAMQQARRIAEHAGINMTLENNVLAIWPRDTARGGGATPLITPLAGMRNYPLFDSRGIMVTCLFRPLKQGTIVAVQSSLWNNQIRQYRIYSYTHTLASELPNGPWFTLFGGFDAGNKSLGGPNAAPPNTSP